MEELSEETDKKLVRKKEIRERVVSRKPSEENVSRREECSAVSNIDGRQVR